MSNNKLVKIFILIVLISFFEDNIYAQSVKINATNTPLNLVLIKLKNQYNIQFSFNDKLLADCIINDSSTYKTTEQAIKSLIKNCDLSYKKDNEVFIIYKNTETKISKPNSYFFSGQIIDIGGNEALPYANILINYTGLSADVNGNFSFKSKDSVINIKVSHIGYYLLDTIINSGNNMKIFLKSSVIGLQEIVIKSETQIYEDYIGKQAGLIRLNNKLSELISGNSDKTIFNILRLQPGILASGEQSKDYIIWGSYKGQTQIRFDGITMFNISTYNDNIGAVNPLIIKNIQVNKGGYNANIGDRVGGVVNLIGKSGNTSKFEASLNINTQTVNGIINIPIAKKLSLQTSFRHTYNDYLNQQVLNNTLHKDDTENNSSSYSFGDLNIKLAGKSDNGDSYYMSIISSNDNLLNNYKNTVKNDLYYSNIDENKKQFGGALFYGKNWSNAGLTNISASISSLTSNFDNISDFIINNTNYVYTSNTINSICEKRINIEHYFLSSNKHNFNIGINVINNISTFNQSSSKTTEKNYNEASTRLNYFIVDKINMTKNLVVNPGLRINYSFQNNKVYFQPRINSTLKLNESFRINIGFGMYNQFISESSIIDNLGNYLYIWNVNTYLSSIHYVSGISYSLNKFNFSIEGYYKKTDGLTRYINSNKKLNLYYGNSKTLGLDFFIERKFGKHKVWITYTLSQTKEHFSYFKDSQYIAAPQDQRHEVKTAGLLNFHPFYFSANYVYGSGIANSVTNYNINDIVPYNRLDMAVMCKFYTKKLKFETGLSIINILNTKNVRYNNFYNFSESKTFYSYASPITPILFLNIYF